MKVKFTNMLLDNARPCFSAPKHDNNTSVLRLSEAVTFMKNRSKRKFECLKQRTASFSVCSLKGETVFLSGPGVCEEGNW